MIDLKHTETMDNAVRRQLAKRPAGWFRAAAKAIVKVMTRDWKDWKSA
jgi:hypothetical protein